MNTVQTYFTILSHHFSAKSSPEQFYPYKLSADHSTFKTLQHFSYLIKIICKLKTGLFRELTVI